MLASTVAILSLLALLAYLDATSIPSVNVFYAFPGSPLTIGFAAIGCWMGLHCVRRSMTAR